MKRINIFIDEEKHYLPLLGLVGTLSEHARRAFDDYLQKLRMIGASASASKPKRKEENNG